MGAVRLRLVTVPGPGPARDGVRRPARRDPVRPGRSRPARRDPRPARPRPAAQRRRPRPRVAADLAQPARDRRPADGPEGAGGRRQRLPRRGALPAPHPPAAPRQHAAGRPVAGDLGRPGRAHGRGRAHRPHRHGAPRAPARGHGPGAPPGRPRRRGLRLPAHRRCRATSAARRSARVSSSDATSSGVRDVSPPSAPAPYSLRPRKPAHREERRHEPCPRPRTSQRGPAARGGAQPGPPARLADPRRAGRRDDRHRRVDLAVPGPRAARDAARAARGVEPRCSGRASCRGSSSSCSSCWRSWCPSRRTSASGSC